MTFSSSCDSGLISNTDAWRDLQDHVDEIFGMHLKDLMQDRERCKSMIKEFNGIVLDYSRQRATQCTFQKLLALAKEANVKEKIEAMFSGVHVGETGKVLTDVVAIGIGGSYLGPLFAYTALQTDPEAAKLAKGRRLRFLANVDPVDVAIAINGLNPETTLVVIVSKTFTTGETILNSKTMRSWLIASLGPSCVAKHMVAVSTNLKLVKEFGLNPDNSFGFWDWVGGRFSVCSAVGILPLALQYGFAKVQEFLEGAWSVDCHFKTAPLEDNFPVLLGLISVWNVSFLRCPARAILPYSQALQKLAPHIQQLSMESNGKAVAMDGTPLNYHAGEIDFGEPGTNGQHSFYQLIHQGRLIPCDFIGVIKSQQAVNLQGELVSNHDELMCNFFAQPDALAYGKTRVEACKEGIPEELVPHKMFTGNRPSLSILLPTLDAYTAGQLLALYEHRIAVQGFVWGINSFDQWGVELGKSLATKVRQTMHNFRTKGESVCDYNYSTTFMLNRFLQGKEKLLHSATWLLVEGFSSLRTKCCTSIQLLGALMQVSRCATMHLCG
ncbi:glucose-6-phosphate isomerase, cytosolic 2B isoform X4 [Physcomitrium patens]|uniref:glucose-6-phosphate isomerase, cytosolic 2B isoform X4 n=1 Tax=Physcomitrium patens TaxID=3218 RepID=UPI000D172A36|nr:glucose-6-phosphate isomerase, cytosolic 2B-like isoform X4 [Physcomitrium patens]|eukprot:XP_024378434.1 glucose-6-phosphate isomerase, cytosolic 2B-like isoform X4 [Physcomitrella patens]